MRYGLMLAVAGLLAAPLVAGSMVAAHELDSEQPLARVQIDHVKQLAKDLPATTADLWIAGRLRNGNAVNLPEYSTAPLAKVFAGQRDLVAIARRVAGTLFQPIVVLG